MEYYEKKYKEALERAKDLLHLKNVANCGLDIDLIDLLNSLFPELKESEDERIRKALVRFHKSTIDIDGIKGADILAWLEKQGKQKHINDTDEEIVNAVKDTSVLDMVEPKFKVGDYIVSDYCMGKVVEITSDAYLLDIGQGIPFSCENNVHLWTIQDAKDGDVLNSSSHFLIWIYKDNEHYHACVNMNYVTENVATNGLISIPNDACPATKDEQTILFAKMHETGYEWNPGKKEIEENSCY